MNFHLAHIVPGKTMHGLNSYKEVIDTVQWGLEQLGHTAVYGLNTLSQNAINILFGMQALPLEILSQLPPETIVYNFEQGKGSDVENVKPQIRLAAQRFRIWDYSEANEGVWKSLGAPNICVVPVGYAPILQRIPRSPVQDIDVLFYATTGEHRLNAFHSTCYSGLTSVYVCGLYGEARDALIARSKVIVNVSLDSSSKIFEIVRVSYLFANHKAVVAVVDDNTLIDDDVRSAIRITTLPNLVRDCANLLEDDAGRSHLEDSGFEVITRRDIRKILEHALLQSLGHK